MNPSMIMSYLSDLNCSSNVEVNIVRSKHYDQIEIVTDEFSFVVDDFDCNSDVSVNVIRSKHFDGIAIEFSNLKFHIDECGKHYVYTGEERSEIYNDIAIWKLVKTWVENYLNEIL